MTPKAQPDFHPDADLLSAFAEHVLPEGERSRILAHVAECGRCREVVFLAQAAAEPAALSVPVQSVEAHPGWLSAAFARWRVALIPVSALAAVTVVAMWVWLHPAPASVQMGQVVEPPSAPIGTMAARMAPQPGPTAHPDHRAASPPPDAPAAKTSSRERSTRTADAPHLAPMQELAQNEPAPRPAPAPTSVVHKRDFGAVHLDGHSASLALQAPPAAAPGSLRDMAVGSVRTNTQWQQQPASPTAGAAGATISALQPRPAPTPAPAPPSVVSVHGAPLAPATGGPQFLDSAGAGPIDTFPETNGFAMMRLARRVKLPSGLNAVSSAAMLNRLLALDSAGAVFLSADGGKHWEAVTAQWSGKAMEVQAPPERLYRVSTAQKSSEAVSLPKPAAVETEPNQDVQPPNPATLQSKAVPPAAPMLFKLVTDRHQTWVSSDGKVWREQ